jgi:di/tricarboxylate transporter
MTYELATVLALLAAAIFMFAINRPRMDVVALIMLVALPLTGIITVNDALAGFSDANIVLIAALFVIGEGLVRTGVARQLGDWLIAKAGRNPLRLMALLMVVVCALGSLMSSTAVTAIFIPVALRICHTSGASPSQLMMPLSMAALISGMMTLIATAPNLVVNSELVRRGHEGFSFFAFTPFGVPVLILGIGYMTFARNWLAKTNSSTPRSAERPNLAVWTEYYKLAQRDYRLRIKAGSPLVGKRLDELDLRKVAGAYIIAIERGGRLSREVLQPTAKTVLLADDVLLVDLFRPEFDVKEIERQYHLEPLPLTGGYFSDRTQEIGMAEVIIPDTSDLIGKTMTESQFRTRTGLTVIGLRRGRKAVEQGLLEEKLQIGDTLLVAGAWSQIERLRSEDSGVIILQMPADLDEVLPAPRKLPQALFCLALVVVLMVSGAVPTVIAALLGCLLMGALGCINMKSAYNAIDWKTIVLIVGMLPFSIALRETGGVELMASGLMRVVGESSSYVVLGSLFLITALLGMFISNTATAVLMAPVALAVADDLGASPYPFAMIIALAASTAFMTPVSSPVNTLVVTPGNYTFGDFVRVGVPFAAIVMIVSVFLVPWLMPLEMPISVGP